ncbi:uncharacterized protein TNCV_2096661 [Trichonephila clavipes]|nr:uncharacterized protein TNCV_2096661 [Trichonephila clavipes]
MGKCRSYRPRKRKFHGKQNTSTKTASSNEEFMTTSSLKLQQCNEVSNDVSNISEHLTGNRLIDLEILIGIFSLLCCPTKMCTAGSLYLVEDSRFGLSSNFSLHWKNCSFILAFCTSKKLDKMNELNTRFVYGLRLIGRGVSAGRKLCAVLNLPPFLSKLAFRQQEKKTLLSAAFSIGEKIMNDAAKGIRQLKKSIHGIVNCGVSVDGTWQRRGFSSLNGCVSAISVDTGKIIDFETLSQFCRKCNSRTEQQNVKLQCNHHKGSSSSMESVGAYRIFERSEDHRMLRYTDYYGDGDSKDFDAVKDIYGKDSVTKLEYIGHIQKRVGTRLRKLQSRNKGLGGKSAVIAAFFHCCSSKHHPKHGQCPVGDESWCKFQRAKASNIVYQDKSLDLPQNIVNTIKPVYMDLCDRNLLKKCLHGKTQNLNESFNAILWQILPKEVFVEHQTLRLGAYIAVVQFNNGFQGLISILNEMGIVSGDLPFRVVINWAENHDAAAHIMIDSPPCLTVGRRKLRAHADLGVIQTSTHPVAGKLGKTIRLTILFSSTYQ